VEKHLLVTVSEHKSALCGLRFVGRFFDRKDCMAVTLLYLLPRPGRVWEEEKSYATLKEAEDHKAKLLVTGRKAVNHAKNELVHSGFAPGRIIIKIMERRGSKAHDIILEGDRGMYDAVVLGRRGLSMLEEAVDESTTMEALRIETSFPLHICRQPDYERTGLLLCVDGSKPAMRMADHAGFMLADEDRHDITLFSVDNGDTSKAEEYVTAARQALVDNNVPPGRVHQKIVRAKDPFHAIMQEVQSGQYAVVATGSTGVGRGLRARLFMGSVSLKLMRNLTGAVLWVMR
jgi:nucleotide-binding universal stress UspA family protein